jgi:hypothetical protein
MALKGLGPSVCCARQCVVNDDHTILSRDPNAYRAVTAYVEIYIFMWILPVEVMS